MCENRNMAVHYCGLCRRVAKDLEDRRSHYEPSVGAVPDEGEHIFKLEEHDFVPHFQRVSVSGEDTSGVSSNAPCSVTNSFEFQNATGTLIQM
jgi:hypothetical protein